MTDTQGSPAPNESAAQQGSPVPESNGVLPNEVPQQFVVENPATPPAVPEPEQGQAQGQTQQQPTAVIPDMAKHYQSIADQRQAEIYRLQQELQARQAQTPQVQAGTETNPYDPQTDWFNAIKWEQNKAAREAAKSAADQAMNGVLQFAQQQAKIQEENRWQQAHPQVDINLVKQWGQMNGVNNLDHAFTLMTLPSTIQSVQNQAANTAFNQFRQPQNVATPVKGGQQAGGTIQLSYDAMAQEFASSNGRAYNQWSPALREAFDRETYRRAEGNRG